MSNKRKSVSFFRAAGALLLSAAGSYGLLLLVNMLTQRMFNRSSMTTAFYILCGISTVFMFLLLLWPANRPFKGTKVFLRWFVLIVGVLLIWTVGTAWDLQNQMMYITYGYEEQSETEASQLPSLEAIEVKGKGNQVYRGWLWKNTPGRAGLVMYFGGNAQYAADAMIQIAKDPSCSQVYQGYNVMMVDYPGYGRSDGNPGEESIYAMAQAVWAHMAAREDVNPDKMVPMGWSLGTGTAARLAADKQPAGVILAAPFYDGGEMINGYMNENIINGVTEFIVRNKYESDDYARRTNTRALILGATGDRMFPIAQAERLAAEYPQHELVKIEGAHHAAMFSVEAQQAIQVYLQGILTQ